MSLQFDRCSIQALRDVRLVRYLSRKALAPEPFQHVRLELACNAVDDCRRGYRPDVRKPLLERAQAKEVIAVAVRDVNVGQVLPAGRKLVGELD